MLSSVVCLILNYKFLKLLTEEIFCFYKWRDVFIERYCLRQNWMKGRCRVKTLTGHTQGNLFFFEI